jgi:hypothetical protein
MFGGSIDPRLTTFVSLLEKGGLSTVSQWRSLSETEKRQFATKFSNLLDAVVWRSSQGIGECGRRSPAAPLLGGARQDP